MSGVCFPCGCGFVQSMFGSRPIMSVSHCADHSDRFSEHTSLRHMADEMIALSIDESGRLKGA